MIVDVKILFYDSTPFVSRRLRGCSQIKAKQNLR
jgi:hypothetical protein